MFLKRPVFHFGSTKCRWLLSEYWTLLATCNPCCWGQRLKPCHKCPCNMKWWLEYQLFIILVKYLPAIFLIFSPLFWFVWIYLDPLRRYWKSLFSRNSSLWIRKERERIGKIWHTIIIFWHVFNLKCTRVYRRSLNMSVVSCVSR